MQRYFHILILFFISINCNSNFRFLKQAGIFKVFTKDQERRIVCSRGIGIASKDDVQALIDSIKELSKDWQDNKGFVCLYGIYRRITTSCT